MTAPKPMGRPKGRSLNRQDIIAAAIDCLERQGAAALGVNHVARKLGIKPPSLYKHVDGNVALREIVVVELWGRFITFCQQCIPQEHGPSDRIRALAIAVRTYARSHPVLYSVMTQNKLDWQDAELAPVTENLLDFYASLFHPYQLSIEDLIDISRMLTATLHGFVECERSGLFVMPRSLDSSYDRMLDWLIGWVEGFLARYPVSGPNPSGGIMSIDL